MALPFLIRGDRLKWKWCVTRREGALLKEPIGLQDSDLFVRRNSQRDMTCKFRFWKPAIDNAQQSTRKALKKQAKNNSFGLGSEKWPQIHREVAAWTRSTSSAPPKQRRYRAQGVAVAAQHSLTTGLGVGLHYPGLPGPQCGVHGLPQHESWKASCRHRDRAKHSVSSAWSLQQGCKQGRIISAEFSLGLMRRNKPSDFFDHCPLMPAAVAANSITVNLSLMRLCMVVNVNQQN